MADPTQNGSCLSCYSNYRYPPSGNTLAPWVEITFEGSGSKITVGNLSSPETDPQNSAIIKSFEFGYSDGNTVRVTIHDEQGGSFVKFMESLFKDYTCLKDGSPAAIRMKYQWGWAATGCSGTTVPVQTSPVCYCMSDSVETNFSAGKFMFDVTGKDLCVRMLEGNSDFGVGGEGDDAVYLKDAINQFIVSNPNGPNVGSVLFQRMVGNSVQECGFAQNDGPETNNGPKGKYNASGINKLATVKSWVDKYPTDKNLGWLMTYNALEPKGQIIFWEDPKPLQPQGDSFWEERSIGTYVVNGGKDSSVIEFNPKIRWDFAQLTSNGGQLGSNKINATDVEGSKQPGRTESDLGKDKAPDAGSNTQTPIDDNDKDRNGGEAVAVAIKANNLAARAFKVMTDNIEADLVIVGEPSIIPIDSCIQQKNVGIVFINPFFLRTYMGSNNQTLEWLAQPVCNPVLSSKAWICKNVVHKIEEGKYTTTLGVFLIAPGADAAVDDPLGLWSGGGVEGCTGWTPVNCI